MGSELPRAARRGGHQHQASCAEGLPGLAHFTESYCSGVAAGFRVLACSPCKTCSNVLLFTTQEITSGVLVYCKSVECGLTVWIFASRVYTVSSFATPTLLSVRRDLRNQQCWRSCASLEYKP